MAKEITIEIDESSEEFVRTMAEISRCYWEGLITVDEAFNKIMNESDYHLSVNINIGVQPKKE